MSSKLLVVEDLIKEYPGPRGGLRVLSGINFELLSGHTMSIMGPSGSGKSSLLSIIGTLDSPTTGRVLFWGEDVHQFDPSRASLFRNKSIGFVFQDHHLLPQCTTLENILIPALAYGSVTKELKARAELILDATGMTDKRGNFPSELSGGERQRVAIARAMIHMPELLLCDEPTGNLDAENSRAIGKLFLKLHKDNNIAIIIVSHNENFARMFDQCKILENGLLKPCSKYK